MDTYPSELCGIAYYEGGHFCFSKEHSDFENCEFLCERCGIIYYEGGHFCFLKEKSDVEYCDSYLNKLEQLAGKLEVTVKINREITGDDIVHSNTEIKRMVCNDLQLNSSLERDENCSQTKELVKSGSLTSSSNTLLNIQSRANPLDVTPYDYRVGAYWSIFNISDKNTTNSLDVPTDFDPVEPLQVDSTRNNRKESHQFEHFSEKRENHWVDSRRVTLKKRKAIGSEASFSNCNKESSSQEITSGMRREYLDAMRASEMKNLQPPFDSALGRKEGDKNETEVPELEDCKKQFVDRVKKPFNLIIM